MDNLQCLLDGYIYDMSKNKVKASNKTILEMKSLNYHKFMYVLHQFVPDIRVTPCNKSYHIMMSSNGDSYLCSSATYNNYPIHIRKHKDTTELIGVSPLEMFDNVICCTKNKPMFVPIIAELVDTMYHTRRLHQMTLVFDTKQHCVFLHDPNSMSLFNNNETLLLIHRYIEILNIILIKHGIDRFIFRQYYFDFMNIDIKFLFNKNITGNSMVASIVFMILYNNLQDVSYIELLLQTTKRYEYKKVYVALYNKIQEFLKLSM
jgi:hypothetical protein